MDDKIGLANNQEYIDQLIFSIILEDGDLKHNNFHWEGNEFGIHLTINGQSKFIPNEANEEEEIRQLWTSVKK